MIMRLWTTEIDAQRGTDYDRFARDVSSPMFRASRGCMGVLFLGDGSRRCVISVWDAQDSIDRLEDSARYRDAVERIKQVGVLPDTQQVACYALADGFLAPSVFALADPGTL